MKHCLNKRIRYETFKNDQEDLPQKLRAGNSRAQEKLQTYADAWRRQNVRGKISHVWEKDYKPFYWDKE